MPAASPNSDRAAQSIAQQPAFKPMLMRSKPGIIRDGTTFDHQCYSDGVWMRFWQDRPRKILGYREQVRDIMGTCRMFNLFSNDGFTFVHTGSTESFQRYAIDLVNGGNTGTINRTPSAYTPDDNVLWMSDTIFQTSGGTTNIFAAPLLTLNDITAETEVQVYYGDVLGTALLIPAVNVITAQTGGIAQAQLLGGPGNLVLNVNAPIPEGAGDVTVTTDGNLVAVNYTITGTDLAGAPLTVGPAALPNNATASVGSQFETVSQVTLSAGTGAFHVSVGWLAGSNNLTTSGGLVAVGPYLFLYGHDGIIQWSVPAFPLDFTSVGAGDSRPVSDKIVKGFPLRGQSAPAAIFWSLSSVIIGNFVGGTHLWDFSTVSTSSSILSANSVIEHNGIYYWATTSGFSQFSGVVSDIPNEYNQQYFLENLNFSQRQKVFAYKVPRFKEIWWCFPFGAGQTECNHAVVLKYDKGYWYDTPLPNSGRGAGYYDVTFNFPIMSGVTVNDDTAGTSIWQHEIGVDEVSGAVTQTKAVLSSFRTSEFNLVQAQEGALGDSHRISFDVLEPDFDQVGDLYFNVYSRFNAKGAYTSPSDAPYLIPEVATSPEEQGVEFKWSGRLTSFEVVSNVVGGNYNSGAPLIHLKPSDGRRTG